MQNKNEKSAKGTAQGAAPGGANDSAIGDGINEFIQKHRRALAALASLILLVLIICVAALSVMDILRARAISAVEEFNRRYEEMRPSITEDYSANDAAQLITELEVFTKRNSGNVLGKTAGYARGKAWSIIASIHDDKKDWAAAEAAWASAAGAAKKNLSVARCLF
jgi:hypothetical protein